MLQDTDAYVHPIPTGYVQVTTGRIKKGDYWLTRDNHWNPMGYSVGNRVDEEAYSGTVIIRPTSKSSPKL